MCQVDSEAEPRHVYWLLGKERTEFTVEDCDAKGRREVLWTGLVCAVYPSSPALVVSVGELAGC